MKMLDLCSGSGSVSNIFRDEGFYCDSCDPFFQTSFKMKVQDLEYQDLDYYDMIWASPPCDQFALWGMPFHQDKRVIPDLSILMSCLKIISKVNPKFWIIENVKGSQKFINPLLGKPFHKGSRYLWGIMPLFDCDTSKCFGKSKLSGRDKFNRAKIPEDLTRNLAKAILREL